MTEATCKSCGRKIIWATNRRTGAKVPLDARRVTTYMASESDGGVFAFQLPETVYISHFATCPNANAHSKGGKK